MSDTGSSRDLLNELAHEFAQRFRRGEHPSLTEYAEGYPELEAEIRDLFPALLMIEQFGSIAGPPMGPHSRTATANRAMPSQLGEYRILREVGRGGMGIVYEAVQESLGRHVALKVLPFQNLADANHLERFRREAQSAARLHHTNIVPVFGVGEHDGVCYFAMQLIHGQPLDSVLRELACRRSGAPAAGKSAENPSLAAAVRRKPELTVTLAGSLLTSRFSGKVPPAGDTNLDEGPKARGITSNGERSNGSGASTAVVSGDDSDLGEQSDANYFRSVARVGVQVAEALAYAHQQGIVHRDIKPSNLLLDTHGTVWVTDFGLAKADGTGELTGPGELLGTLRYMAPERFQGRADPRSDVFSLGLTLYEMVTLRPAFAAVERAPLIERMLHAEPPRPRQLDGRIPRDLETIILKAIGKEPARRYQTAGALAADLQLFLGDRPILARRSTAIERFGRWCRRNPWLAGANVAAAVLTTTLAIGSTLAAWTFHGQRDQIGRHLAQIQTSETRSQKRLFESLAAQARASRHGGQIGQRFESLSALAQAATIARENLKLTASGLDSLRHEAIACMTLPDLKPVGRVIEQPPGAIGFAFDLAMTRYALLFRDGTIQVRRVTDDVVVARFRIRGDQAAYVFGFSPDGRYLASTNSPNNALTVWEIEQGTVRWSDPDRDSGLAARFSPDSRHVATSHVDGELLVTDLVTGRCIWRWHGPSQPYELAFRPDGSQLAILYSEKSFSCRIVEAASGKLVRSISLPSRAESVAWSADSTSLATPSTDRRIYVWDAATGNRRSTLEGSTNMGVRAAFHPSATLLASNGHEGRLRIWDPVLGRSLLSLNGPSVTEFSKDGRMVVLVENRFTTYQVDPALEYQTLAHVSRQLIEYQHAAIRPDGRVLAVATSRGVALWDLAHGQELGFLPIGFVWRVIFDAYGDLLAGGSIGVQRWPVQLNPDRGEFAIGPPRQLPLPVGDCEISEDRLGRIVALADHDVAFVATPERTIHLGPLDDCRSVAVSPEGEWLATGSFFPRKSAQVWRIGDTTKVADLPLDDSTRVVFSPDGRWLMTTTPPCRLWTVGSWSEARQFRGEGHCFSPDGRLVVVVDATRIIHLVEIETGRTVARLESPDLCGIHAATFSPDGSRLVITTNDGPAVHVWDLRAVRRQLGTMGLDWDAPTFAANDPGDRSAPPLPPLRVDRGPLPLTASIDPIAYEPVLAVLEAALASQPDQPAIRGRLAERCNNYAWNLATASGSGKNPERALTLARRSVELAPKRAIYLNTLGVAQYRAGQLADAIATLNRSLAAGRGESDGFDLFFLAMAHWQTGDKSRSLTCYNQAVAWSEQHRPGNEELAGFRAEAAALLGLDRKPD